MLELPGEKRVEELEEESIIEAPRGSREEVFALVVAEADREKRKRLAERIFQHSVEDGLILADRLKLSKRELADIVLEPTFIIKHPEVYKLLTQEVISSKALHDLEKNPENKAITDKLAEYNDELFVSNDKNDFEDFMKKNQEPFEVSLEGESAALIDDHYAPLLKARKFVHQRFPNKYFAGEKAPAMKSGETRVKRSVDELADEALMQEELLLSDAYYARPIEEAMQEYLKDKKMPGEAKLSEAENMFTSVQAAIDECERLAIPYDDMRKTVRDSKYISLTAGIKKAEAERGVLKRLNESLAEKGKKVELIDDKYQIKEGEKKEDKIEKEKVSDGWDDPTPEKGTVTDPHIFIINGRTFGFNYVTQEIIFFTGMREFKTVSKKIDFNESIRITGVVRIANELMIDVIGADSEEEKSVIVTLDIDKIRQLEAKQKGKEEKQHEPFTIDISGPGEYMMGEAKLSVEFLLSNVLAISAKTTKENYTLFLDTLEPGADDISFRYLPMDGNFEVVYTAPVSRVRQNFKYLKAMPDEVKNLFEAEDKSEKSEKKEEFDFDKFEQKSLDYIEKLLDEGADKDFVAMGLAGLDSDRAWRLREKLLSEGAFKGMVAQGLAGLDSERAWKLRENLMKNESAAISSIALGLAGLDSEKAWRMRDRFLEEGTANDEVVQGLAGLDSERAWKLRENLLRENLMKNESAAKSSIVLSLAGLDSERAWQMREKLLSEGAVKNTVAQGLAGLDSERAWKLREKLLEEGYGKGSVAQGIAGLDSDRAWQMREKLLSGHTNKKRMAESLAGLDSEKAWKLRDRLLQEGAEKGSVATGLVGYYLTFVWQLKLKKEKKEGLTEEEIEQLDLLNLLHRPTLDGIEKYFDEGLSPEEKKRQAKREERKYLSGSSVVSDALSKMIGRNPRPFLETMPAKRDRLPNVFAQQIADRIFPEIKIARQKEAFRGFSGYGGLEGAKPEARQSEPEDYLNPSSDMELMGGGGEGLNDMREVMESREALGQIVSRNIYGRYDTSSRKWRTLEFAFDAPLSEPTQETTVTLPKVGKSSSIALPKPLEARVLPERVKGFDASGKEYDLKVSVNKLGEAIVVNKPASVEKIAYSLTRSLAPAPMKDLAQIDYNQYKQRIEKAEGGGLAGDIVSLPEELELDLLRAITTEGMKPGERLKKKPKDQVAAIERLVRDLGYYDIANDEVGRLKAGKPLEEQIYIMEQRIEELKQRHPEEAEKLSGKRFAGVCADFAQLTTALLRRAGFASGIINGFSGEDKTIRIKDAHATSFVVWPDEGGHNRVISIDGTPDGVTGVSMPSLIEREAEMKGREKEISAEAMKEIQKIIDKLNAYDVETVRNMSNGELERVLNDILKYQVKESHLSILERLFDYYWYTPMHQLDFNNPAQKGELIMELAGAVERQRKRLSERPEADETPAGNKLMQVMEDFLGRFEVAGATDDKRAAIALMEKILELVQNELSDLEKKSAFAVLAYLRAQNILGEKK